MKTPKTFLLMGATLSFWACAQKGSNTNLDDKLNYITIDSANKMIQSYLTSIPLGDTNQLISMIVEADDLRVYLSDTSVKGLKLMLGHPLSYINEGNAGIDGGLNANALTVIFAGFNQNGDYILGPNNKVSNKVQRCPPFCINSGNASNNLIE